jgi:hypothetical protein
MILESSTMPDAWFNIEIYEVGKFKTLESFLNSVSLAHGSIGPDFVLADSTGKWLPIA